MSELQFADLYVKFGRPPERESEPPSLHPFGLPPSVAALTEDDHRTQTREAVEQDEVRLREDQLAMALVEDPVRYEELLRNGDLEHAVGGTDGGDDEDEYTGGD